MHVDASGLVYKSMQDALGLECSLISHTPLKVRRILLLFKAAAGKNFLLKAICNPNGHTGQLY